MGNIFSIEDIIDTFETVEPGFETALAALHKEWEANHHDYDIIRTNLASYIIRRLKEINPGDKTGDACDFYLAYVTIAAYLHDPEKASSAAMEFFRIADPGSIRLARFCNEIRLETERLEELLRADPTGLTLMPEIVPDTDETSPVSRATKFMSATYQKLLERVKAYA